MGASSFQHSQMALMASTISRILAAGRDHSIEKRLVMCGLIWVPSPRMNRPLLWNCRSFPRLASSIGFRAKATAIEVPNSILWVCSEAIMWGRKGSRLVSAVHAPE